MFQENGNSFPDNKVISSTLSKENSIKKFMKRVMPFAQAAKESVAVHGVNALNLTMDFDEISILNENLVYLTSTLEV